MTSFVQCNGGTEMTLTTCGVFRWRMVLVLFCALGGFDLCFFFVQRLSVSALDECGRSHQGDVFLMRCHVQPVRIKCDGGAPGWATFMQCLFYVPGNPLRSFRIYVAGAQLPAVFLCLPFPSFCCSFSFFLSHDEWHLWGNVHEFSASKLLDVKMATE